MRRPGSEVAIKLAIARRRSLTLDDNEGVIDLLQFTKDLKCEQIINLIYYV